LTLLTDYYVDLWGRPSREAEFEIAGHGIEVYKWDADSNPQGVAMYATLGASVAPAPDSPTHRNEFYVGLLPENDDVAWPLATLASHPLREGVGFQNGSSLVLPEPLWPGTGMTGFLVLEPVSETIPTLEIPGGNHIVFLQATPAYEEEIAYKAADGAASLNRLLDYWQEERVPHWDPRRGPALPPA
jgi:suppressor of fused protein SUFU